MHARWRWGLVALGLGLLPASDADAQRPDAPRRYAITGARVFTGTGPAMEAATVVIEEGLIIDVGPDASVPAGAWEIDGSSKTVYPGFIDALGTLGLGKAEENGEDDDGPFAAGPEDRPATTTWRSAAEELDPDDERIETWRNAGFTTTVSAPSEGIFTGQASALNLAGERARDMVVATPLALRVNLTPPGSGRSFPGSLLGVIAYVEQVFLDAEHYRASWDAYEASPRGRPRPTYDRALEPVARAQAEGWPVLLPGSRRHEILRALEIASEAGVRPVVYGAHEGYAAVDALKGAGAPVLVSLDWPEQDEEADPEEEVPLRVLRLRELAPTTPAALESGGVRFGFHSGGLDDPEEVLAAVREARERGLSEAGAVRALTLAAAEIYGLDDRLGSLEPGKIANLVIADGDVFAEETRIESVLVDGVKFDVREKEGETE